MLRIDAVKSLQQRWQAEAQSVPLDRKQEQKLWDAFRKPIDEAFNRKSEEREKAATALSERDRAVLEASKSLEAANASGDMPTSKAATARTLITGTPQEVSRFARSAHSLPLDATQARRASALRSSNTLLGETAARDIGAICCNCRVGRRARFVA